MWILIIFIIFIEMQSLKGIIPRPILSDESFSPVLKRAEEYRKATQQCIDFFQQINKLYEDYVCSQEKVIVQFEQKERPIFYASLSKVIRTVQKSGQVLTQNTKSSFKELTSLCNTIFHQFSKFILNFQQGLRQYQSNEQIIYQMIKKYFKTHKVMLNAIEAYKSSFSDVALIYNGEQKVKRYNYCEDLYKTISDEYEGIVEKVNKLSAKKMELSDLCKNLEGQFIKVAQIIGSKIIGEAKNFFEYFCKSIKDIISFFAQEKYALENKKFQTFFAEITFENDLEIFDTPDLQPTECIIPYIFAHHAHIKEEYLENFNSDLVKYMKKVEEAIQRRKVNNKAALQFFLEYFKNIEKVFNPGIKQMLSKFQKMKKKLGESFSFRLVSFIKSINSIFELNSGINQKMLKRINPNLQKIQTFLNEENKLLKLFGDELKAKIQKFIGKKQIKKIKEEEFTEETTIINARIFRKQIAQKSQFISHLIMGFQQKMDRNFSKAKTIYEQTIKDYYQSINQLFGLCCEYQQLYFGEEQFKSNFQKYQNDINIVLSKEKEYLGQLMISSLKNERQKIVFDGQFSKIDDFKKIKKPKEKIKAEDKGQIVEESNKKENSVNESQELSVKNLPPQRQTMVALDDKELKNAEFLSNKITFIEGEELLKSFACALVQKIVLQGRIYISTERICFHSKFNSGNVFFGGTFIQIPKNDIKKVEKKKNSFFLDNMISITTINGEVSFTSFFSRDQAYDLICKTFSICLDDEVYEFDENQEELIPQFLIELQQEDDMKKQEEAKREQQIAKLMPTYEYANEITEQIQREGFNALKIFKVFYSEQPITIGKRSYPNFLTYFKHLISHKDLEVGQFSPSLQTIINQSNLKANCSLKTERKIRCVVPVSAAGVPFMPKTGQSQQLQTFWFFSKHKWILQSQVSTSGVPYSDTFNVQLRTTVESTQKGITKIEIKLFVNFLKNTMMKGTIEGKAIEETINISKNHMKEIKKYLLSLDKNTTKKNDDPLAELKEEINEKDKQIEAINEEKSKLIEEVENLKNLKQTGLYLLIGSAVLNFILIILTLF